MTIGIPGFFSYELRTGHRDIWSTAQGRFGPPLRVTGVQHPAPQLVCAVVRNTAGILVSAPFALPGTAAFTAAEGQVALEALALDDNAPLSVLAVELMPNGLPLADPLGASLGAARVLRTSPLTPVPTIC